MRYPSCFYFYYLILYFIPKPNSKLPFFKWLSASLPNTISLMLLSSSLLGTVWPMVTSDAPSQHFYYYFMIHLAWLFSSGVVLEMIFNNSLWPSQASLDQSMLCEDERSKFKPAYEEKNNKNIPLLLSSSSSDLHLSPCPHYVAVQYLCIYFCCYLMIIIYCIRTRFALFEDEFQ